MPQRYIDSSQEDEFNRRIKDLEDELDRLKNRSWFQRGIQPDYVFLDEVTTADLPDIPLEFNDIDQGYRHLVIEASLRTDNSYGTDLTIRRNSVSPGDWFDEGQWIHFGSFSLDNPSIPVAESGDENKVRAKNVMADQDVAVLDEDHIESLYTQATMKFSYYSKDDRIKSVLWQAVTWKSTDYPDGDMAMAYSTGGGFFGASSGSDASKWAPLTGIQLDCDDGFQTNCFASLYGIT